MVEEVKRGHRLGQALVLSGAGLRALRRGLALLCFVDVISRLPQATLFLSDLGVLPRFRAHLLLLGSGDFSLYLTSGRSGFAMSLLVLTAAASLASLSWTDRRWIRVVLFISMSSLQARNPLVCDSADDLLRLMLFWDMLMPNLDDDSGRREFLSVSVLGYQLQLSAALLSCAFFLSSAPHWGSALPGWFWVAESWIYGAGAVCVWVRPFRRMWLAVVAGILGARAYLVDPAFPITLFVACLGLWRRGGYSGAQNASWTGYSWRQGIIACALMILGGCGFLGLHQDWTRIYPSMNGEVMMAEYRQAGSGQAFLVLGPAEGRRSAWLARHLFEEPRIAATSLRSAATLAQIAGWVELWQVRQMWAPGYRLGESQAVLRNREMMVRQ